MNTLLFPLTPVAVPTMTVESAVDFTRSEAWYLGFSQGTDGTLPVIPADLAADLVPSFNSGLWAGWDNFETEQLAAAASVPTIEDEFEDLGFRLGLDGEQAELVTPDADERSAFERGMNAGDVELWRVDPDFASHAQALSRVEPMATKGRHSVPTLGGPQVEPAATWHDSELAEVGAFHQLVPMIGGGA